MDFVEKIQSRFGDKIINHHVDSDIAVFIIDKADLIDFAKFLKDNSDCDCNMLTDVSAVDFLKWNGREKKEKRFEVIYHLYSLEKQNRVRIKVPVDENESVPTLSGLYDSANWAERECYDLLGVIFEGHPDLRRIIMPDKYPWHPLRKDQPQNPEGLDDLLISDILLKNKDKRGDDGIQVETQNLIRYGDEAGKQKTEGQESDLDDTVTLDDDEYTILNIGPSHPATHGILQNIMKLDGETIIDTDITIGFVHRCLRETR